MSKTFIPVRVDVFKRQIITKQTPLMQEGLHLQDSTSKGIPHVMNQSDVDIQLGKQVVNPDGLALQHPHTVEDITKVLSDLYDRGQHTRFNIPYIVMIASEVFNQFIDQMRSVGFIVKNH